MLYRVVPAGGDVCVAAARVTSDQVRFEADDDGCVYISANCAPRGIPASRVPVRWCSPPQAGEPFRRFAIVCSDDAAVSNAHWRVIDAPTASDPARVLLQPTQRTAVDMASVTSIEFEDGASRKVMRDARSAVVPPHITMWRPYGELRVPRTCHLLLRHFNALGLPSTNSDFYALTGVSLALREAAAGIDAEAAVDAEHIGAQLLPLSDVAEAVALCQSPAVAPRLLLLIDAAISISIYGIDDDACDASDAGETLIRMQFAYKVVADDEAAFPGTWWSLLPCAF